jgi:2-polyprenyl-3-methyl-5-hydroxy-6-metoxy-1,4-benzoquinol methylase
MGEVKLQSEVTDKYGFSTLDTIASADKFNRWMYDVIAPYCNGDILEIGGGIGNISMQLLLDNKSLTVTELHEEYCEIIRKRLTGYKGLRQVVQMDITDKNFDGKYQEFFNRFDSVFALNVIEHIDERDLALQNCQEIAEARRKSDHSCSGISIVVQPVRSGLGPFSSFSHEESMPTYVRQWVSGYSQAIF